MSLGRGRRVHPALLAISLLAATTASAGIVGSDARLAPILREIADALDAKEIDVVGGKAARVRFSGRARVAQLAEMPNRPVGTTADWMTPFLRGSTGIVGAVKSDNQGVRATSESEFDSAWEAAPPEKRVFLSFTRADHPEAVRVAEAIETRGYVTFIFLQSRTGKPRYEPAVVGRLFSQAGHHLVIDTPNARKSPGVALEAQLAFSMRQRRGPEDRPNGTAGNRMRPLGPRGPGGGTAGGPSEARIGDLGESAFLKGLQNDWIVTSNPDNPNKLFVHREAREGQLVDALFLIDKRDGEWRVYSPRRTGGGLQYGRKLGTVKPVDVNVSSCSCR